MQINTVTAAHIVETDSTFSAYTRHGPDSWVLGQVSQSVSECAELETAFQKFMAPELKYEIALHEKIKILVGAEIKRCNATTANDIVNELLWLALQKGDISRHYSFKK